jgi:hypothetical protein
MGEAQLLVFVWLYRRAANIPSPLRCSLSPSYRIRKFCLQLYLVLPGDVQLTIRGPLHLYLLAAACWSLMPARSKYPDRNMSTVSNDRKVCSNWRTWLEDLAKLGDMKDRVYFGARGQINLISHGVNASDNAVGTKVSESQLAICAPQH